MILDLIPRLVRKRSRWSLLSSGDKGQRTKEKGDKIRTNCPLTVNNNKMECTDRQSKSCNFSKTKFDTFKCICISSEKVEKYEKTFYKM